MLGGTIAIPSSASGEESFFNGSTLLHGRKWCVSTYYATLDGLWAYPMSGDWFALGGFRWVYWQTSYEGPNTVKGGSASTDTADVTVTAYLPLLGFSKKMGGLTLGALGFPSTRGSVVHNESFHGSISRIECTGRFDGGYFAEVFAEYGFYLQRNLLFLGAKATFEFDLNSFF